MLAPPRVGVGRGRVGVTAIFAAPGAGFATFATRVPAVKASLHLSAGTLGVALLGAAVGLASGAVVAGWWLRRSQPALVMAVGLAGFVAGLEAVPAARGPGWLFAALAVMGLGGGLVDVAMNAEAAALQVRAGRSIMSRFHAGWSVGGLVGSGLGALAAASGLSVRAHFVMAGLAVVALGASALWALGDAASPGRLAPAVDDGPRARTGVTSVLVVVCVLAAGDFLAEGAAGDWGAVYLHGSLGAGSGTAALAFSAFTLTMTAGRIVGDHLTAWLGPVRLMRLAAGVAGGGLAGGLLIGHVAAGLVAFGLLGAGLSVVVPLLFTAASAVGHPSTSVALATGCGYLGLVVGPPVVGGLADVVGLPGALGVVALIAALPMVFGRVVAGRPS